MVNFTRLTGRDKLLAEGVISLKRNPGTGLCCATGCRNKATNPKKKVGDCWMCSRHWQMRWRKLNPKQASYRLLKDHAVARGIPFTLTLQTFLRITEAAGYWTQDPATHGDRLSVDRIDIDGPYSDDNVRIITISENVAAGNRDRTRFLSPEVQAILARRRGVPQEAWQMDEGTHWLDDDGDPF